MKLLVLLEHGRGIERWRDRFESGKVSDSTPYSYHLARHYGHNVEFSTDESESFLVTTFRRGSQRVLGFDLLHVLRNRKKIRGADVVWTHTEQIHLAYTAWRILFPSWPPALCNSVWVADEYPRRRRMTRWIWRQLLRRSALNLTMSEANATFIRSITAGPVRVVRFGLDASAFKAPAKDLHSPLRVLSVGNDRHRNWALLAEIARLAGDGVQFRILSRTAASDQVNFPENVEIRAAHSVTEVCDSYQWSDVVAMPLHSNLHASGITVAMEANAANRPVLVSNVGGIDNYFMNLSTHMPSPDATAEEWLDAIDRISQHEEHRLDVIESLSKDITAGELTAAGYIRRLINESEELLSLRFE